MYNCSVSKLSVGNYLLPESAGSAGQGITTNGLGHLSFTNINTNGNVGISSINVPNTLTMWDSSNTVTSTSITATSTGALSGIVDLSVTGAVIIAGFTYPINDGSTNQAIVSDVSGVLSFVDVSLGKSGTGTVDRIVRWDTNGDIKNSTLAVNASSDLSGCVNMYEVGRLYANNDLVVNGNFITESQTSHVIVSASASQVVMLNMRQDAVGQATRFFGTTTSYGSSTPYVGMNISHIGTQFTWNSSGINIAQIANGGCDVVGSANCMAGFFYSGEIIDCSALVGQGYATTCNNVSIYNGALVTNCTDVTSHGCTIASSAQCGVAHYDRFELNNANNCMGLSSALCEISGSATIHAAFLGSSSTNNTGMTTPRNNVLFGGNATRKWAISSVNGTIYSTVAAISNPVPDFAEYFENEYLGILPYGTIVTCKPDKKIGIAGPTDKMIGVVSSRPAIIAGGADMHWHGAYVRNVWGVVQTEEHTYSNGCKINRPILSPSNNINLNYVPRSERPEEWTCVGLIGQVRTMVDESVMALDYVVSRADMDGVGTKSIQKTNIQCMKLVKSYTDEYGYGIALCFVV